MKENIKKSIRLLSIFLLTFGFLFVTGCSTLRDWWEYSGSTSRTNSDVFTKSDLHQFYSSVHPVMGAAESDYRLARYFQKRGKHKFAVDELLKAIRKDPSYVKAYNALGVSYDNLGQFDLAVKSYQFALNLNPQLDYVYNNLGYSYLIQKNYDAAIVAFKKAIALNDTHQRYHNNLGLAYARKGQPHLAADEFNLAKNESNVQPETVQNAKDQNPSAVTKTREAETFPIAIVSYKDIPKDTGTPPLLAGNEHLVSDGSQELKSLPDDVTGIELPKKPVQDQVNQSDLPQKVVVAEAGDPVRYTVQVSASKNLMRSTRLMEKLTKKGYPCPYLNKVEDENPFYRVRLGSFIEKGAAERCLSDVMINKLGHKPFIAFEDEHAKKILLSNKQGCFNEKGSASSVVHLIDIEIANGNGVRHMARNVGIFLTPEGFRTTRLTNADHFNYPETKIYYRKGFRQDALRLAEDIPGPQKAANIIETNRIKKRAIKVLIGKDLVPFHDQILGKIKTDSNVAKGGNSAPKKKTKIS